MQYWQKLQDPRWQKKRLEIFMRDGFQCRCCKRSDKPLHAHHRFYVKGKEPWDYEDSALVTLCDECHEESHSMLDAVKMHWDNLSSKQKDEILSLVIYADTSEPESISGFAQKLMDKYMRGLES